MPSTAAPSARYAPAGRTHPEIRDREGRRSRAGIGALITASVVVAAAALTPLEPQAAPACAAPMSPSSGNAPIHLGPGISLTPADGWTINQETDNYVHLDNADGTAILEVTVGTGRFSAPAPELDSDIQQYMQNYGYTNVQLAPPESGPVNSRIFQQVVTRGFTADDSTPSGTAHKKGMFTELMNNWTRMAAFAAFQGDAPDAYDAAHNDATDMINSML
jgi:hypothetical protein